MTHEKWHKKKKKKKSKQNKRFLTTKSTYQWSLAKWDKSNKIVIQLYNNDTVVMPVDIRPTKTLIVPAFLPQHFREQRFQSLWNSFSDFWKLNSAMLLIQTQIPTVSDCLFHLVLPVQLLILKWPLSYTLCLILLFYCWLYCSVVYYSNFNSVHFLGVLKAAFT